MKLQINIARNIGDRPMDLDLWQEFQSDVRVAILSGMRKDSDGSKVLPDVIAAGTYTCDVWKEESYFILADISYSFDKIKFLSIIQMLTQKYQQNSIAVTHIFDSDNFLVERVKL